MRIFREFPLPAANCAHIDYAPKERASAQALEELAQDRGGVDVTTEDGVQVTARLDAASQAAEDHELDFWLEMFAMRTRYVSGSPATGGVAPLRIVFSISIVGGPL